MSRPFLFRALSCLRWKEIVVLQGSPLLGAAFALGVPSAQELGPLALLLAGNFCLVAHVFLLNDWAGLTDDLADPTKAAHVFTARGISRGALLGMTLFTLLLGLVLLGRLGIVPLGMALGVAGLSALYSLPGFNWKGRPLLNSVAHLAGGTVHFLLGYGVARPLDGRGWAIALFFALTFAAGHLTQELRDYEGDVRSAIQTNAVRFGQQRTFAASLALFTLAHAVLFTLALTALLPRPLAALAVLYPLHLHWSLAAHAGGLTHAVICHLQERYRALYAVMGVAMIAALMLAPHRTAQARNPEPSNAARR